MIEVIENNAISQEFCVKSEVKKAEVLKVGNIDVCDEQMCRSQKRERVVREWVYGWEWINRYGLSILRVAVGA